MVTGSLGHDADGCLLLARGSPQITLVLVRVFVGAANRLVVLSTLKHKPTGGG